MALSRGEACVKYLLFLFNLIFVLTAIAAIAVGAIIPSLFHDYKMVLEDGFFSITYLLIGVGIIVFIVSFFGCCGAIKENHCMIIMFSVLLIMIFIVELAGGIAAYVLKDQTAQSLQHQLNKTSYHYGTNEEATKFWDTAQKNLKCCGVTSYHDWSVVFHNNTLPHSCCQIMNICTTTSTDKYTTGCIQGLYNFVEDHAIVLGGCGIGIAIVQLFGVILSCKLAAYIRNNRYV